MCSTVHVCTIRPSPNSILKSFEFIEFSYFISQFVPLALLFSVHFHPHFPNFLLLQSPESIFLLFQLLSHFSILNLSASFLKNGIFFGLVEAFVVVWDHSMWSQHALTSVWILSEHRVIPNVVHMSFASLSIH